MPALLIDSLDSLPAAAQRRVFGAARATEEGGTLTVVATAGANSEALRWATTRIVLESGGSCPAANRERCRPTGCPEPRRYLTSSVCAIVVGCTRQTSR